MTFKDIFKKSFMEGYSSSEFNIGEIASCLIIACIIGIFIFAIYRIVCRKEFFSKNFAISLISLSVITAAVILTVQSSVVISLGMVGALSIVRFRTAIKDPLDLIFLFWSITCGIISGAGLALIAVALSVVVAIILLLFNFLPTAKAPKLLILCTSDIESEERITETVKKYCKKATVRSRSMTKDQLDMIIEIVSSDDAVLTREIMKDSGMISASVVNHDGEVTV